jgi:hypothetical protein
MDALFADPRWMFKSVVYGSRATGARYILGEDLPEPVVGENGDRTIDLGDGVKLCVSLVSVTQGSPGGKAEEKKAAKNEDTPGSSLPA